MGEACRTAEHIQCLFLHALVVQGPGKPAPCVRPDPRVLSLAGPVGALGLVLGLAGRREPLTGGLQRRGGRAKTDRGDVHLVADRLVQLDPLGRIARVLQNLEFQFPLLGIRVGRQVKRLALPWKVVKLALFLSLADLLVYPASG